MAATQFGTSLILGASTTITLPNASSYYVESVTENEAEIDEEKTYDADGAIANIAQFGKYPIVTATLICKTTTAAPATDFPVGTVITIGADKWYIASAPITKTKSPHRVTVRLIKYNLALVV
jgi:hypothetical protein